MHELVRKIAAAGHTIGNHTWTHKNLDRISPQAAAHEIDMGFAAIEMALQRRCHHDPRRHRSSAIPSST